MTGPHNRKLKMIQFALDGNQFECQLSNWKINNNTEDGEKLYGYCPDGETREEADPDYSLDLVAFSDWRSAGFSDFMWANDGQTVEFQIDHHYDIAEEHVRWTGELKIKAPSVGGEVRTTEISEITLPIIGKPEYLHL